MGYKELTAVNTTVPRVKKKILPRRSIAKIIETTPLDEMVYLFAPSGYGKTMAIMSWMQEMKKEAAWVNLVERDADSPSRLWELLTSALLRYVGDHEKADTLNQDVSFSENPRLYLSDTLVRVAELLDDRVLIIDNYSLIQNTELLSKLKEVIGNMLPCWRVILIGRGELPPCFNDFALKKRLRLITMENLCFSLEEMSDYFIMNGYDVGKDSLIQIREETEGWAAALNAIMTTPNNGTLRYGSSARARVMGFIDSEIWEPLDESAKNFLMRTSILDKLTPSICHSITNMPEANPMLNDLYTNGCFMTKLDEYNAFCYHRVFKDFLLFKLNESGINVSDLYVTVGWWYYEQDESVPALLSFYKAGNISGINQAFKKVYPAKIGMDKYVEVASCLISFDVNDLIKCPEVAARIALLHFIMGNIKEMQRIHNILREWYIPGNLSIARDAYMDFTWEMGWLRYVNPDEDILFNDDFEEWINVDYAHHLLESDRSRSAALRLPSAVGSVRDYSVDTGKTVEYYETRIKTNPDLIKNKTDLYLTDLIVAEIAYEQEDFSKSERIINSIISEIEREQFTDLYFMCTVLLVKIRRATSKPREIDKLIERLGSMIQSNNHHFLQPNFHAFELRNQLENGKVGVTEVFRCENEPYEDKSYYYLIYRHITLVRALLSETKYSESILVLGKLALLCRQYKRNMDLIEINILQAVAEYGMEHEDNAHEHIMTALSAGRKCGFIRIFSDDAAKIWPILNLIRKGEIDEYIDKVMLSCKKMLPRVALKKNTGEPLTKAETEVFRLLRKGLSNDDIAKARSVKPSTVKSQVISILAKLGVSNRASAIALKGITVPKE